MTEAIENLLYTYNRYIVIGLWYFKVYIQILRYTYTCFFPFDLFLLPIDYTVLIIAFSAVSIMLILIKTHTKAI